MFELLWKFFRSKLKVLVSVSIGTRFNIATYVWYFAIRCENVKWFICNYSEYTLIEAYTVQKIIYKCDE